MTVNFPGMDLSNEDRVSFKRSVYGKPGASTREEVRHACMRAVEDFMGQHGLKPNWQMGEQHRLAYEKSGEPEPVANSELVAAVAETAEVEG